MNTKKYFLFLFIITVLISCKVHKAGNLLKQVNDRAKESQIIGYNFYNKTENLFNETNYIDSGKVMFYKIDGSQYGFGLHAIQNEVEYIYDGVHLEKLKHAEGVRVIFDTVEIRNEQDYFSSFPFGKWNPMHILNQNDFIVGFHTEINTRKYFVFKKEHRQQSKSDSTLIVAYEKLYYVSTEDNELDHIHEITIRGKDTLQISEYYFKNIIYGDVSFNFTWIDSLKKLRYRNVSQENEYEEFDYTPIQAGAQLEKSIYADITGNHTAIYGKSGYMSLIMFSFIGCSACEKALKDIENENYNFKDGINLFYSSFQNNNSALKTYIEKKRLPFTAFGKESNMIEDFEFYHSPTFVLINSEGLVLNVIEGYGDSDKKELFELLFQNQSKN